MPSAAPLIVCYHAVSGSWPSVLAVPEPVLARQLALLARRGYVGLTLADSERRRQADSLPRRCVVVTFDDGYASTLRAKPLLDAVGFPATVFPVTRFAESGEPLAWPGTDRWLATPHAAELQPLDWEELKGLARAGWEIGSHTRSHPDLTRLDDRGLAQELEESREDVRRRLGRCDSLAYPYGVADPRVAAAAARAGYAAGCTLTRAHRVDTAHMRPRTGLYRRDVGLRLRVKFSRPGLALRRTRLAERLEPAPS